MARKTKKRKKRGWLRRILLFVITPLAAWLFAFMAWFFWRDIRDLVDRAQHKPAAQKTQKPSREKLFEEDRKKLDEILKKRKK